MKQFGLIGRGLSHSFSRQYFSRKFRELNLDAEYCLFEKASLEGIREWIHQNPLIAGLNVTIPYKTAILPFLDYLSEEAQKIGAVNTLKIESDGSIKGFNTDVFGFEGTLLEGKAAQQKKGFPAQALILGTGGASKSVQFVLEKYGIAYRLVSRNPKGNMLGYENLLAEDVLADSLLIVNTTPLGMYPNIDLYPDFPYEKLNSTHWMIDLIYNPELTLFLQKGISKGVYVQNGLNMLYLQAEKAWEIWQSE